MEVVEAFITELRACSHQGGYIAAFATYYLHKMYISYIQVFSKANINTSLLVHFYFTTQIILTYLLCGCTHGNSPSWTQSHRYGIQSVKINDWNTRHNQAG